MVTGKGLCLKRILLSFSDMVSFYDLQLLPQGGGRNNLLLIVAVVLCMNAVAWTFTRMASSYVAGTNCVAYVTAPSEDVAKKIARVLVEEDIVACVNILPQITSVYKWKNKLTEDSEVLMMIKTRSSRIQDVVKHVQANHPYECPEIISLPIESGSEAYLNWVSDAVKPK